MTPPPPAELAFRPATVDDVPALVRLLADDPLGATREDTRMPLPEAYRRAFASIDADPNNELVIATLGADVVGMLQLTFIPCLTHQGSWRALVEGVRIGSQHRSAGFGTELFAWARQRAIARGCRILQLTSDKQRPDAIRFYEALGFVASHEGMKLALPAPNQADKSASIHGRDTL